MSDNPGDRPDTPDMSDPSSLEARFADIVAHYDDELAGPLVAGWSDPTEDTTEPAGGSATGFRDPTEATGETSRATGESAGGPGAAARPTGPDAGAPGHDLPGSGFPFKDIPGQDGQDLPGQPTPLEPDLRAMFDRPSAWRVHEPPDEPEEHYEPPPPAPLPAGDLQFWGILIGLVGGPLLLLYLVLFNRDAGRWWMFAAIGLSLGGFGLLIARLPSQRDDDDDDGARI